MGLKESKIVTRKTLKILGPYIRDALCNPRLEKAYADCMQGKVSAQDARAISASAARLSTRMCLVLSGPALPPRSAMGGNKPKTVAADLIQRHLSHSVKGEEITDCYYLGKTNSFVVKFSNVGKGSDHEKIISQCRDRGFLHLNVNKARHFVINHCPH